MTNEDRAERFNQTLVTFDELSQTILKGHLLVEEELSAILEKLIGNSDIVSEARLTFFQKLKLVEAAFGEQLAPDHWRALEKVNSLRNQTAHKLNSPKVEKLISEIVAALGLRSKKDSAVAHTKEYQIEMVAFALMIAYGDLAQLRESLDS